MLKVLNSVITNRIVYWLLHWIWTPSFLNVTPTSLINRNKYNNSFAAYNNTNNSAFIINIITISCLLTFQTTNPPNNLIANAYKLFRSGILSAKNALLATSKISPSPNYNASPLVRYRYAITLSAA